MSDDAIREAFEKWAIAAKPYLVLTYYGHPPTFIDDRTQASYKVFRAAAEMCAGKVAELEAKIEHHSKVATPAQFTLKENQRLRAKIAALEAEMKDREWQPIESAPTDGRFILLAHAHFVCEGYRGFKGEFLSESLGKPVTPFTHWMPLPTPPTQLA